MAAPRRKLYLIDGYSNIFRAFYAIRDLTNSKGLPTNAVYGFVTMLRKLLADQQPDLIAAAFDTRGPTFRTVLDAEYKANRPSMPDDLAVQVPAAMVWGVQYTCVRDARKDDGFAGFEDRGELLIHGC